jgi:hypothetical protein
MKELGSWTLVFAQGWVYFAGICYAICRPCFGVPICSAI